MKKETLEKIERIRIETCNDCVTRNWDNSFMTSPQFWGDWDQVPEEEREVGGEDLKEEWRTHYISQLDEIDEDDPEDAGWRQCPRCFEIGEDYACPVCHGEYDFQPW